MPVPSVLHLQALVLLLVLQEVVRKQPLLVGCRVVQGVGDGRRAERHQHVEEQELVHDADEGMSHMLKMKSAIMAMLHRSW